MQILIIIAVGAILFLIVRALTQEFKSINDRWHRTFAVQFSTQQFYQSVEEKVKEKQIPDVKISRANYSTKGLFSVKREYLRVKYHEYLFDICAAPFANDFFVSWWQSEVTRPIDVGFAKRRNKTFYEMDTELMFRNAVRICVEQAVEEMNEATGGERQITRGDWVTDGTPALTN